APPWRPRRAPCAAAAAATATCNRRPLPSSSRPTSPNRRMPALAANRVGSACGRASGIAIAAESLAASPLRTGAAPVIAVPGSPRRGRWGSVLAPAVLAALVPDQSGTCSDRQHRDPGARAEIDTGIGQLTAAVRGIVSIRGIGVLVGSHVLQCLAQQECPSQHALLRVGLLWLGGGEVLRRRVRGRGCWRGRGRA